MTEQRRGTSPWVWVGCGCVGAVVLAVAAVVGLGVFGFRTAKGFVETLKDPVAREAKVREVLGAESLPEGYHGQLFLSVPFFMDLALLSDAPAAAATDVADGEYEPQMGEKGLLWIAVRGSDKDRGTIRRYLAGESEDAKLDTQVDVDVDFEPEERLGRGSFEQGEATVRWAAFRGHFRTDRGRSAGTYAMALAECPGDARLRFGWWWVAETEGAREDATAGDPGVVEAPPEGAVPAPVAGGPADEAALEALLGHFDLCRR